MLLHSPWCPGRPPPSPPPPAGGLPLLCIWDIPQARVSGKVWVCKKVLSWTWVLCIPRFPLVCPFTCLHSFLLCSLERTTAVRGPGRSVGELAVRV